MLAIAAAALAIVAGLVIAGNRDTQDVVPADEPASTELIEPGALRTASWSDRVDGDNFPIIDVIWIPLDDAANQRLALRQNGTACIHLGTVAARAGDDLWASMTIGVPAAIELLLVDVAPEAAGCVTIPPEQQLRSFGLIADVVTGSPPDGATTFEVPTDSQVD